MKGVSKVIVHEDYGSPTLNNNDIAILVLNDTLPSMDPKIGAISRLAIKGRDDHLYSEMGTIFNISGYGFSEFVEPRRLRYVEHPLVNFTKCYDYYEPKFNETHERVSVDNFCSGNETLKFLAVGDSGGRNIIISFSFSKLLENIMKVYVYHDKTNPLILK